MKAAVRTKRYTLMRMYSWIRGTFLAHLTQRVKWAFVIIWHPSSVIRLSLCVNFAHFNHFFWNRTAFWTNTLQEWCLWGRLQKFMISSWSIKKHVGHRQFLFLIGWYLKNLYQLNYTLKLIVSWYQWCLWVPLQIVLILFWSGKKHCCNEQFMNFIV
jgi:hypothetical protein